MPLSPPYNHTIELTTTYGFGPIYNHTIEVVTSYALSPQFSFVNMGGQPLLHGKQIQTNSVNSNLIITTGSPNGAIPAFTYSDELDSSENSLYGVTFKTDIEVKLSTITGVNLFSTGQTLLYTVPTGKTLFINQIVVRCTAASAVTTPASASVDNTTTGDIAQAQSLVNLLTTNNCFIIGALAKSISVSSGSNVYINISTAATGTSQTASVDLIGFLE